MTKFKFIRNHKKVLIREKEVVKEMSRNKHLHEPLLGKSYKSITELLKEYYIF